MMDYLPRLTWMLVVVQLGLLWSPGTDAAQLNDYILDYQPLQFNHFHLHEKHSRVKRSLDSHLLWNFKAYGRTFNLQLSPVQDIFAHDHTIHTGDTSASKLDTNFIYQGHLTDDPNSEVHMSILNDSISGSIYIPGHDVYHIEPAYKHMEDPKYHSIIYPESRMNLDPYRHKRYAALRDNSACGTKELFTKLREMSQPVNSWRSSNRKKRTVHLDDYPHNKYSAFYNSDILTRRRRALRSGETTCFLHLRADKILYDKVLRDNKNDIKKAQEEIIAKFAVHVQAIKRIYSGTTFELKDGTEQFRGVTFQLQRSTIMKSCQGIDSHYCTDNVDVTNFLDITSLEDHSQFCLVHTFTYRDFIGGTLGLAWVATPEVGSAGVCGSHGRVKDSSGVKMKSLNTGITTLINFNKEVPSRVSELTFAHEVGHNFGSQHDQTAECAPYGTNQPDSEDGNYIMFPSANQGNLPNNVKFSVCSRDYIAKVLQSMIDGPRNYCFEAANAAFCGNNVVEEGEQCDCGYQDECQDSCCNPRPNEGVSTNMCNRTITAVCSPSEGVCCNSTCNFIGGGKCRDESDCTLSSNCSADSAICPKSESKPNITTFCNDYNGVCLTGQCIGSICLNIDWKECSKKIAGDSESDSEELCYVSCQAPNSTTCISSNDKDVLVRAENRKFKELLEQIQRGKGQSIDDLGVKKPAGSSCNFNKGYCDILSKCRNINAEGPFKQLTNLIFNPVTLQKIQDWATEHWWAVLLMALGGVLLMVLFVKLFGYNTPSEDPKKAKRNAAQNAGGNRGRQPNKGYNSTSSEPGDQRSRPPERASVYATDIPMHDYGSRAGGGQTNYGYDGRYDVPGKRYDAPPAYPNYAGPPSHSGRSSLGHQYDRIAMPPKY